MILLIILSFSMLKGQDLASEDIKWEKIDKLIIKNWEEIDLVKKNISYNSEKEYIKNKLFYKVYDNSILKGYLCVSKTKGRFDYFTYIILLSEKRNIGLVRVIEYNSEHGYQIMNKKWLNQFINISSKDTIKYGVEIDAIAGATISGNAITNDVVSVLIILEEIIN